MAESDGWDVDPNAAPARWDPVTPKDEGDGWDAVPEEHRPDFADLPEGYRYMANYGLNEGNRVAQAAATPDPMKPYQDMTQQEVTMLSHRTGQRYKDSLDTFGGRFGRAFEQGLGSPGSDTIGSLVSDPMGYVSQAQRIKFLQNRMAQAASMGRDTSEDAHLLAQAQEKIKAIPPEYVDKLRSDTAAKLKALQDQPGMSSQDSIFTNIKREWADLFGGMSGGLADPRNYMIPVPGSKTLTGAVAKGALANYPMAVIPNIEAQQGEQTLGLRDKVDLGEALGEGGPGALLGGVINAVAHKSSLHTRSAEERAKLQADAMFKDRQPAPDDSYPILNKDSQVPPKPPPGDGGGGYPTISDEFNVPKPLEEGQAASLKEALNNQPLQQPGTPDGWEPVPMTREQFRKKYPTIAKKYQVAEPVEPAPKANPYPTIDNGFGPDVDSSGFKAPQLGLREPLSNLPHLDGDNVDHQMQDMGHTEQDTALAGHPSWIKAIGGAKNLGEALDAVANHPDLPPALRGIAESLKKYSGGVGFELGLQSSHEKLAGNAGIISTNKATGKRTVWATMDKGVSPRTILHEAQHAADSDAFNIARVPELAKQPQYRKQVTYAKEMTSIWQAVKDRFAGGKGPKLPTDLEHELNYALESPAEFTAQVKSFPELRAILKDMKIQNVSALDRVKNAVYKFLGMDGKIKHGNLADRFLFNEDQLSKHQQLNDAMRAKLVERFGKGDVLASQFKPNNYETWNRIMTEFLGKPGDIFHLFGTNEPFVLDKIMLDLGTLFKFHGRRFDGHDWVPHEVYPHGLIEHSKLFGPEVATMDNLVDKAVDRLNATVEKHPITDFDDKFKWNNEFIYNNDRDIKVREDGSPSLKGPYGPKQDLTPAEKGWTNIIRPLLDGGTAKGPGKFQAGAINPQAVVDTAKWFFGLGDKAADAWARKLAAQFGPLRNVDDMKEFVSKLTQADIDSGKYKDLPGIGQKGPDGSTLKTAGLFSMQNQLAMAAEKNPLASSLYNLLRRGTEKSVERVNEYDRQLRDSIKWWDKNTKDGVKFWREWEHVNVMPELKPVRDQIEAGGDAGAKQYLMSKGVTSDAVDKMLPFAKVMADVERVDREKLREYGRDLEHEPFYLPLGRPGPYHIQVMDPAGKIQHAEGFDNLADARRALAIFKEKMPAGWTATDVLRTDPSQQLSSIMTQAMIQGGPQWLRDAANKMYMSRIEWERKFEISRAADRKIGGYLGEIAPTTDAEYRDLAAKYLRAFAHRVRESHHLENASEAVGVIDKVLTGNDHPLKVTMPNTFAWMHAVLSRHIGLDLTSAHGADALQQGMAEEAGKIATKADSIFKNYQLGKNDNVFGPRAAHAFWQGAAFIGTATKILASPVTTIANLLQNGFIHLEGIRHAALNGNNPLHALEAQVKVLAYYMNPSQYPEVKAFLEQAGREGLIDPHGREDYSLLEKQDRQRHLQGLTDALQYPRDKVEKFTNHWSIAYTKFYVDAAYNHLGEGQKKDLVYNLAHDFTANYSQLAKLMAYDKLGAVGHAMSNFSKWNFNRIGRYMNDLRFIANLPEIGPRVFLPVVTSMMISMVQAGYYGAIGVVDYEAMRHLGQATGMWDWRPASAWINKLDPGASNTARKGFLAGLSDDVASTFWNEPSGPDVSGSMRESSPLEVNAVTFSTLADMIHDVGIGMKGIISNKEVNDFMQKVPGWNKVWDQLRETGAGKGLTSDNMKQVVNSLPTVVKGPAQDLLLEPRVQSDGTMKYVVPELKKDQGMYVRNEFQRRIAQGTNIRTTDENNAAEGKQVSEWTKRQKAENLKTLKDGLETAVMDPALADTNRVSENARDILNNHGEQALNQIEKDLTIKMAQKLQTDYIGNELMAASRMKDAIAFQKALQRIEEAKQIWNHKEPSNLQESMSKDDIDPGASRYMQNPGQKLDVKTFNKYPALSAGLPNVKAIGYDSPGSTRGAFVLPDEEYDGQDKMYINKSSKSQEFAARHEGEHLLANRGLGSPTHINQKFDEMTGKKPGEIFGTARKEVTRALTTPEVRKYLNDKWGVYDAYFDPAMYEFQGVRAPNLLFEQFASLATAEDMKGPGADMTKDPFLREHVFNTKDKREAFRALTGLRQTRLDSKDLPPYTKLSEDKPTPPPQITEDGMISSLYKKLLK